VSRRERIEEYLDGLLSDDERAAFEAELARDPVLREELDRVRRFGSLLDGLPRERAEVERILATMARRRRRRRAMWTAAALAAAVLGFLALRADRGAGPDPMHRIIEDQARAFGRRLGAMAAERRAGRVPRIGLGGLEVPPSAAWGLVFLGALDEMGVPPRRESEAAVKELARRHFMKVQRLDRDLEGQWRRAEAALEFYRRLRDVAGGEVADAYYDVFRPGLADPATAVRVAAGSLPDVVRRVAPQSADDYLAAYDRAVALLASRYGEPQLDAALAGLAPVDRRAFGRDATEDGVGRDANLTIRALLYRLAVEAGLDVVLVDAS
jgi:anti-sigma factor RsiW